MERAHSEPPKNARRNLASGSTDKATKRTINIYFIISILMELFFGADTEDFRFGFRVIRNRCGQRRALRPDKGPLSPSRVPFVI